MEKLQALIEGVLFVVGDEGIALDQLASCLEVNEEELLSTLDAMGHKYTEDETRGIEMVCYGGKYKLVSKADCHPYCQKLYETSTTKAFSQAALETLAIIAYKQPVTRVEIEEIRGVNCDMMLRKLLARGLIEEAGRLDLPGKPYTYEVTSLFMDTFKLESLDELPPLPDYRQEEQEEKELFD